MYDDEYPRMPMLDLPFYPDMFDGIVFIRRHLGSRDKKEPILSTLCSIFPQERQLNAAPQALSVAMQ